MADSKTISVRVPADLLERLQVQVNASDRCKTYKGTSNTSAFVLDAIDFYVSTLEAGASKSVGRQEFENLKAEVDALKKRSRLAVLASIKEDKFSMEDG